MKYTFETVFGAKNLHLNPDRVGKELEQLMTEDGVLTHDALLEFAANKRSHVAKAFEWDNRKAAARYRRQQARALINAMRVKKHGQTVHAFVNLEGGKGYYSFETVMANEELREQHMNAALRGLTSLQTRYKHLTELARVWAAADKVKRVRRKSA